MSERRRQIEVEQLNEPASSCLPFFGQPPGRQQVGRQRSACRRGPAWPAAAAAAGESLVRASCSGSTGERLDVSRPGSSWRAVGAKRWQSRRRRSRRSDDAAGRRGLVAATGERGEGRERAARSSRELVDVGGTDEQLARAAQARSRRRRPARLMTPCVLLRCTSALGRRVKRSRLRRRMGSSQPGLLPCALAQSPGIARGRRWERTDDPPAPPTSAPPDVRISQPYPSRRALAFKPLSRTGKASEAIFNSRRGRSRRPPASCSARRLPGAQRRALPQRSAPGSQLCRESSRFQGARSG